MCSVCGSAQLVPSGVGLVEDPHLEVTGLVALICSHIYSAVLDVLCVQVPLRGFGVGNIHVGVGWWGTFGEGGAAALWVVSCVIKQ